MKQKLLCLMLEDVLDANIVQLNNELICSHIKINHNALFLTGLHKEKTTKKTLCFSQITSLSHINIGKWEIVLHNQEKLLLQCYTIKESGLALNYGDF